MARPGVTYIEVANAAQAMVAAGKYPTIEAIRAALGTGSNSTLGTHLRNWKAQHLHNQSPVTNDHIPSELITALKGVWEQVNNLADEKIQANNLQGRAELAKLQEEFDDLQAQYTIIQQQNQQQALDLNICTVANNTLEYAVAEYKQQIATLEAQQAVLIQQTADKQERIEELRALNQQVQANLEHYRSASQQQRQQDQQRYEQHLSQLEATLLQANQQLTRAQSDANNWQNQLQKLEHAAELHKNELANSNAELANNLKDLQEMRIELAAKNNILELFQAQNSEIQRKLEELTSLNLKYQTQSAVNDAKIFDLKAEVDNTLEQNKILLQQNWSLERERNELLDKLKALSSAVIQSNHEKSTFE